MSAILRWFNDGDVRYRAYYRAPDAGSTVRELIIASRDGQAVDVVDPGRPLEDYSDAELLAYAQRLRIHMQARAELAPVDTAAD